MKSKKSEKMKKTFRYIYGLLAALIVGVAFTACSPDSVMDIDPNQVPKASDIDVEISVDQEVNQVTFTLKTPECTPIWKFSDGSKSTINGCNKIYAIAGEYEVEISMYNRNGICDGSIIKKFTINNTIFDYAPYLKRLCGTDATGKTWQIAAGTRAHLACGEPGSDGTGWWAAGPNEKAGTGLYDNRFVFANNGATDGGAYTFDPGTAGTFYVNKDATIFPEYNNAVDAGGNKVDFRVPSQKKETTFKFEVSGPDLYVTLPAQTVLGYVPNDEVYNSPRFKVASIKENSLELVADNGKIAWHYILEPVAKELTPADMLASVAGKTWTWDANNSNHLGCGPSGGDGLEWWHASPNEKSSFGIYTQSFTFKTDGTYIFNPGEKGLYVNKACTYFASENTTGEDFLHAMSTQTSTWKLEESGSTLYLVFPEGTFLGYLPNDAFYKTPRFKVLSITADKIELVADEGTIAWHYTLVTNAGTAPEGFNEGAELLPSEYAKGLVGTWTWEASTDKHFGCGQTMDNATGWYAAAANEKADKGLYDDLLTFGNDGSYTFDPGAGGTVLCNVGLNEFFQTAKAGATEDFQAPFKVQKSTYILTQESDGWYITFPAQTVVSYVPSDEFFKTPKVKIVKMTENVLEFNTYNLKNGDTTISWHYRWKRVN